MDGKSAEELNIGHSFRNLALQHGKAILVGVCSKLVVRVHPARQLGLSLAALLLLCASGWPQNSGSGASRADFDGLLQRGFAFHKQSAYAEAIPLLQRAYRLQPKNYFVNLLLGIDLLRTGKAPDAVTFLKASARIRPGEEFPYEYLGEAEASLGHFSQAAKAYISAAHVAPDSPQSAVALADFSVDRFAQIASILRSSTKGLAAEYRLQAVSSADGNSAKLDLLAHAAELDGDAPGIWSELAFAQFTANGIASARQSVNRAIEKDANDLRAWEVQVLIAASDNHAQYVIDRLKQIGDRSPSALIRIFRDWPKTLHIPDPSVANGMATKFLGCLQHTGCTPADLSTLAVRKHTSATTEQLYREQRWELVAAQSSTPGSNHLAFYRGVALARLDRCQEAIPLLEESFTPALSSDAGYWLSVCYARETANVAERVHRATHDDAAFHMIRGDVLLRLQGKARSAIQEYQVALENRKDDPSLWARLAESQLGADEMDLAKESAEKALNIQAKCLPAKRVLAKVAMQERDYAVALPYLRELVANDPRDVSARIELGTACAQTGCLEEALANLDPALQQGYPDEKGSLHYLLGTVLKRLGKATEAQEAFQTAQELSDRFQQGSRSTQ
jgi:tetratricopeptide (TPR) repeat protein